MIEHTLDKAHSILYVRPTSSLQQGDFAALASTIDPYITETGDLAERGVGHDADLPDALVVVAHEPEVGRHRTEAFPAGKRGDLDDEAGQVALFGDVGIDGLGQCREVPLPKRRRGSHVQDGVLGIESVFDHGGLPGVDATGRLSREISAEEGWGRKRDDDTDGAGAQASCRRGAAREGSGVTGHAHWRSARPAEASAVVEIPCCEAVPRPA